MKSVELFSGCGGLATGLHFAGFEPLAVVEKDKDAFKTIISNSIGQRCKIKYHGDISNFNYSDITDVIDLVSGGPPCQPFSLGGKHKAHEDSRDMFPEAARAIRELKPKAFIFENVKGLLRGSFASYFDYIIKKLTYPSIPRENFETWEDHALALHQFIERNPHSEEYIVKYKLLNAADYGVPQKRERVFIVGFRADLNISWDFPSKTHSKDALSINKCNGTYWQRHNIECDVKNPQFDISDFPIKPWVTVRDAIGDLPTPYVTEDPSNAFSGHIFKDGARIYAGHTGSDIDEPSKTIKAGAHGVPGGENMIRYEDQSVRYFTVREAARIQTFPDDFIFHGAWGEAMRQIGNAVPVKLAEAIGTSVYSALKKAI